MNNRDLEVLFISPAFFGYETDIVRAMESYGVNVHFYDERPSNTSVAKAIFRVGGSVLARLVRSYYRRILVEMRDVKIDTFVLIKGEIVPRFFLEQLRARNPGARFVYYSFDAIPDGSNPIQLFDQFDVLYSFDPVDVQRFQRFQLKHLFYTDEFYPTPHGSRTFELAFVGTLHSDRFRFVAGLLRPFERGYAFFYAPAKWYFALTKYVTRSSSGVPWSDVSFDKMPKADVAAVFRDSDAVLDIQRSGQSGLTMRTFEVLASGSILVTGNPAIRDAEIFDPDRIVVVDGTVDEVSAQALRVAIAERVPMHGVPDGFEKYHVRNWVKDLLEIG